jgi:hypothetical protein
MSKGIDHDLTELLSMYMPGGTEEYTNNFSHDGEIRIG